MSKTWSASRDQILQQCERRYFFQYLAGARLGSDDPFLRELALLKKLKTALMWQGELFHWAVAVCCNTRRKGSPISKVRLLERLSNKIGQEWEFSKARRYRMNPFDIDNGGLALFEHEYDESSELLDPNLIYINVTHLLDKFFLWAGGEANLPSRVAEAAKVWVEPQAFGKNAPGFDEGDVQVLTKVDLAIHGQDGRFEIFDWKTGKAPERTPLSIGHNDLQVNTYQLWPRLRMNLGTDTIFSRLVYFGGEEAKEHRFELDEESILVTRGMIHDSIALAERWRCDVEQGKMALDDLDYAQSEWNCRQCPFKKICWNQLNQMN